MEQPPPEETRALQRAWGPAPISTQRVSLPNVDVSPDYDRCKGEGAVVVLDARSRIVLLKRSSNHEWNDPHRWVLPSGRIRLSETIEDGAVREAREETGLDVSLVRLLRVDWVITEFLRWMNKRMHFTFMARRVGGVLQPSDRGEILRASWFQAEELPPHFDPSWLSDFLQGESSA